jgi:hypothetical protein
VTVASLLLIVVAVVLLGYGLLGGSNIYLIGSILTSILAAVALIVSTRRAGPRAEVAAAVAAEESARGRRHARRSDLVGAGVGTRAGAGAAGAETPERAGAGTAAPSMPPAADQYSDRTDVSRAAHETAFIDRSQRPSVPAQGSAVNDEDDDYDEDEPADEPPPQHVLPADAARVAQLTAEVLVIDGRPRYHLPGCVHLLGRDYEPLPVGEAVELGFTPCSLCEPDSALLATARRV